MISCMTMKIKSVYFVHASHGTYTANPNARNIASIASLRSPKHKILSQITVK